jgi:hypothetical protein
MDIELKMMAETTKQRSDAQAQSFQYCGHHGVQIQLSFPEWPGDLVVISLRVRPAMMSRCPLSIGSIVVQLQVQL